MPAPRVSLVFTSMLWWLLTPDSTFISDALTVSTTSEQVQDNPRLELTGVHTS